MLNLWSKILDAWRYLYRYHSAETKEKNGQYFLRSPKSSQKWGKPYSFATYFEQHCRSTMSRADLRKRMMFKVVKQLNWIGAMKIFIKPNYNLCIEKFLMILKKLCDKYVILMNKNLAICVACQNKSTFHQFFLSTDDTV